MFAGSNRFSFELLQSLFEQQPDRDIFVSSPVVYLPLALLRSVALGTTRTRMTQALLMNELLTEELRLEWVQTLVRILNAGSVSFGGTLVLTKHWGLSPKFIERAQDVFQILVSHEDVSQLQVRTHFVAQIALAERGKEAEQNKVRGIYVPDVSGKQALTILTPPEAFFWQNKQKPLQELLCVLNQAYWLGWQMCFQEAEESRVKALPLSKISGTFDLLPLLTGMELGPGVTPSADFSPMVVSGNPPYLVGLRHGFNLTITANQTHTANQTRTSSRPFVWFLTDIASGLILALGVQCESAS